MGRRTELGKNRKVVNLMSNMERTRNGERKSGGAEFWKFLELILYCSSTNYKYCGSNL
jgi:hypothetical protein